MATIFMQMAETAEALGYSHSYFQNHWRAVCATLKAPFPINHHRGGARRWRRADIEAFANGESFEKPGAETPGSHTATQKAKPAGIADTIDWNQHFIARAHALQAQTKRALQS